MVTTTRQIRVGSSKISQVFHDSCEERKSAFENESNFGERENWRICQQIMKEAGAHIEWKRSIFNIFSKSKTERRTRSKKKDFNSFSDSI